MTDAEEWPPRSPLKTLLSSPSGRKKYRDYQESGPLPTSPNKLLGSPSLLEKLRAARADRDHEILQTGQVREEEDDEETIQLKLQVIEAKLKLKKLQKAKELEGARPTSSATSSVVATGAIPKLEVPHSPTRKPYTAQLSKSPSRVLLGIDKGISAADVSLKRVKTTNGSPTKPKVHHVEPYPSRVSALSSQNTSRPSSATSTPAAKSFSERMEELRSREMEREQKDTAVQSARSGKFKLDKSEVASYHARGGQQLSTVGQEKYQRDSRPGSTEHHDTKKTHLTATESGSAPNMKSLSQSHSMSSMRAPQTLEPTSTKTLGEPHRGDPSLFEGFSGTHLASRILPHTFLKRILPSGQFTTFTIPKLLKTIVSPDFSMPDDVTDYVIFGVVATKSAPRDHKPRAGNKNTTSSAEWEKKWDDGTMNKQKFIIVTLTDLKWSVELFLFDNAVPRYHRLTPGTLIAILNPGIMPPRRGKEDTGKFSLTLNDGEDQVLEIGKAKHLGYCKTKKADGTDCGDWLDSSKSEICEYHVNAEITRVRRKRAGVNTMDYEYGSVHSDEKNRTKTGFDFHSQSRYYAVGGVAPKKKSEDRWSFALTANPSISSAKLLDLNPGDDPFIAEGQFLERDKQDRLRKQMAAQQKERDIAKKLGNLGSGGAGGAYMRQRTTDSTIAKSILSQRVNGPSATLVTKDDILADKPGASKKRAAGSIRLGPVRKKTRFLTEGGIKEAGRESLGPSAGTTIGKASPATKESDDDDDDDDDLDIV